MGKQNGTILALVLWLVFCGTASATQLYVTENGWWHDGGAFNESRLPIRSAVNAADIGDSIFVYNGSYIENVNVNKKLTLEGEGADVVTVTAKSSRDHVFEVTADCVNISGFAVTGVNAHGIAGIHLNDVARCKISDNTANSNRQYGIHLVSSSNNMLMNNTANSNNNGGGISLHYSSNNILTNNTASLNNYCGISLYSSNNNTLTNNTADSNGWYSIYVDLPSDNQWIGNIISDNINDIYIVEAGDICTSNQILHNINSKMLDVNETVFNGRTKNIDEMVNFEILMFDMTGSSCPACDYEIVVSPNETVNSTKTDNKVTGNFTATRSGTYFLNVKIIDSDGNIAQRRHIFLVGDTSSKTIRYYLRDIDPTHGQPTLIGQNKDCDSLLFAPPTQEEWGMCGSWVQCSPDELPGYPLANLNSISVYVWYTTDTDEYIGIQRYATYDSAADYKSPVPAATYYTCINRDFTDLNWSMDYYWSWYWLSVKLSGKYPHWKTNQSHPSGVNFTYAYTTTPAVKSISNTDISVLSATSPADNRNNATIVLEGDGTTSLTVQMPNITIVYTAKYDGNDCNNNNCSFTQANGELNFTLTLGSVHTLDIEAAEFYPVEIEPAQYTPTPELPAFTFVYAVIALVIAVGSLSIRRRRGRER